LGAAIAGLLAWAEAVAGLQLQGLHILSLSCQQTYRYHIYDTSRGTTAHTFSQHLYKDTRQRQTFCLWTGLASETCHTVGVLQTSRHNPCCLQQPCHATYYIVTVFCAMTSDQIRQPACVQTCHHPTAHYLKRSTGHALVSCTLARCLLLMVAR
jgi:hypothetical protein